MIRRLISVVVVLSGAALGADAPTELTSAQRQFFEGKIRPLLAEKCYKCHSAETGKIKGGLALDTREGLAHGGENGVAIVPGHPENSLLIKSILYTDADLQMPPKGEKLTEHQIADLTAWVKMGAPDPRAAKAAKLTGLTDAARAHWAYQPIKPQAVPKIASNAKWVQTPIDAFVLDKLQKNGLRPAAAASKAALLRRATYDLIGLPPTYEELEAFEEDHSPNAFEKVVDRLLASPHYGERWGRYWLDTARYADTAGPDSRYNDYRFVYSWTYRDYVINALNTDKPYDEFLKEQIAADLMPESKKDPSCLAALGFLTVGRRYQSPHDTIAERIDTLTKATQGVTVACARCHDHKFDPIPTADYYSMYGIFASTVEPPRKPTFGEPSDAAQREDFENRLAALEQKNRDAYYHLVLGKGSEFRTKAAKYLEFVAHDRKGLRKSQLERIRLIKEYKLDQEVYSGIRTAYRMDPVLGAFSRYAELSEEEFAENAVKVTNDILSNKPLKNRPPVNPIVLAAIKDTFSNQAPISLKEVAEMYGKIFASINDEATRYVKACEKAQDSVIASFHPNVVQLIETPFKAESSKGLDSVALLEVVKKLPLRNGNYSAEFVFAEINELELTHPGAPMQAMVLNDAEKPHDYPIMIRGEPGNRGPIVPRRYIEIVDGSNDRAAFKEGSGRLQLAEHIASKSNPLTARAIVNRIWLHHFGEAFIRTPEDIGTMSEKPSHPELMDYLAQRFMDEGWSFKKMHKLIMLSSSYQQSGTPDAAVASAANLKDPENRMLWHANLRRLDFESLRDSMLAFTGQLDTKVGGHPINLTDEPFSYRRSVYGYIDRAALSDLLTQFDFADPDMPNSRRATTIVPQQALFFMNSSFTADVARKITARPQFKAAEDESGKITALYRIVLQRDPKPTEMQLAEDFLASYPPESKAVVAKPTKGTKGKATAVAAAPRKTAANFTRAIQNEGTFVEQRRLTPWEQLAETLLFMNDVSYVD